VSLVKTHSNRTEKCILLQLKGVQTMQQPLWTRNFVLICLVNFLIFTSFYFLLPTLPLLVTGVLKGDAGNVGYIIGSLSLTAVLVRPFSGYLLDTVGRKKVLCIALAGFTLAMGAYSFVASLTMLFALRILHGVVWGFTTTSTGTVATDLIPPPRRGEGMGYYGLSNTLAMAVGPALGLYILGNLGFDGLFTSSFVIAIISLLCVFGITYQDQTVVTKNEKLTIHDLFEPRVFSLAAVLFFTSFVYGGIVSFITLYGKQIGVENAGIYFIAYAITLLLTRPYAGKIFDKGGPLFLMAFGFVAMAQSFVVLFLARDATLLILSALLMGVGFSIIQPVAMAMAINRVEPFRRGAANGTIFTAFDLGIGSGSILLGFLAERVGLASMYLFCSLIVIIPTLIFYLKDAPGYRVKS
jgi:MFS family permease